MSSTNSLNLEGQTAIVTGAGRGIGRAVALRLAAAGAGVAVLARTQTQLDETVQLIKAAGGQARAWAVDVTQQDQVDTAIREAEAQFGPIAVLVNNAGRASGTGPIWMVDPDSWWLDLEVNVKGPFLCSRAVLPSMMKRGSGCIVNMGSNVAIRPTPYAESYASSKAALLRLTDSMAVSLRPMGIKVFAISPGWVWTEMTYQAVEEIKASTPDFQGVPDSDVFLPEAAAELVARLASGEADQLTGRYIHVGDDLDAMLNDVDRILSEDLYALRHSGPNV